MRVVSWRLSRPAAETVTGQHPHHSSRPLTTRFHSSSTTKRTTTEDRNTTSFSKYESKKIYTLCLKMSLHPAASVKQSTDAAYNWRQNATIMSASSTPDDQQQRVTYQSRRWAIHNDKQLLGNRHISISSSSRALNVSESKLSSLARSSYCVHSAHSDWCIVCLASSRAQRSFDILGDAKNYLAKRRNAYCIASVSQSVSLFRPGNYLNNAAIYSYGHYWALIVNWQAELTISDDVWWPYMTMMSFHVGWCHKMLNISKATRVTQIFTAVGWLEIIRY